MAQEKQQKEYAACPVALYTENCDSVDHSRRMRHNLICQSISLKASLSGDTIFMRRSAKRRQLLMQYAGCVASWEKAFPARLHRGVQRKYALHQRKLNSSSISSFVVPQLVANRTTVCSLSKGSQISKATFF